MPTKPINPSDVYTYPQTTTLTRTLEQKRAMLRKALVTNTANERLHQALLDTLQPVFIRKAAQRGVFICYHRSDEVAALELDGYLRELGIKVWMDTIDIPEGRDWRSEVITALRKCGILLMLLSPAAIQDHDLKNEAQYFINTGKIVVPVVIEACEWQTQLPTILVPPVILQPNPQFGRDQLRDLLLSQPEAPA